MKSHKIPESRTENVTFADPSLFGHFLATWPSGQPATTYLLDWQSLPINLNFTSRAIGSDRATYTYLVPSSD